MPTQEELRTAWETQETLIYRVLDDQGNNLANAQVRQYGDNWLFYDDVDGYVVLGAEQVHTMVLA